MTLSNLGLALPHQPCAGPDCVRMVPVGQLCCIEHWKRLPASLRKKLNFNREHCGADHPNYLGLVEKARRVWAGLPPRHVERAERVEAWRGRWTGVRS